MSWRDRDYSRYDANAGRPRGTGMGFGLPKPTHIVKYLLIANIAIFVITSLDRAGALGGLLALKSTGFGVVLEFWTLVTYQFVHANTFHILFNMIGLYFLGPPLEHHWGGRRFLTFYLGCGVAGGILFLLIGGMTGQLNLIVGASGAVLGLLAACAVLFPGMMIILLFFPVPIRVAAMLLGAIYALAVISEGNLSHACHLGGMAAGLAYVWLGPRWRERHAQRQAGSWQRRAQQEQAEQELVDRILDKVHREGIQSLTRREKRVLRDATDRQRTHERRIDDQFKQR